jgi:hypothetical protein
MTVQSAKQFLELLEQDVYLQKKLNTFNWDAKTLMRIATAYGYFFNDRDLQNAIDEAWGNLTKSESEYAKR